VSTPDRYDIRQWCTGKVFMSDRPYQQACRMAARLRDRGHRHIVVVYQGTGRAISEVIR
jgi:hypothetical protein